MARPIGRQIRCKCLNSRCNKIFYVTPVRAKKTKVKFCSYECKWFYGRTSITCKGCKKKFVVAKSTSDKRKFCSSKCNKKHKYKRIVVKCKRCRRDSSVTKSRSKNIKFCSAFCCYQYRNNDSQGNHSPYDQPCKNCKKPVKRYPSQFKTGRGRFCSKKCTSEYRVRGFMEKRIKRICGSCKKEFSALKCRVECGEAKFCSKICASKGLENHEMRECAVCGNPCKRVSCRIKKTKTFFCSDFCRKLMFNSYSPNARGVYTPDFLRFLSESTAESCPFPPSCSSLRAFKKTKTNPWRLCRYHAKRIDHALRMRRERRQEILRDEGLMFDLIVSEPPETPHHQEVVAC